MAAELNIFKSREEWLAHRTSYIGGSDAACIVGLNPWKSNVELWEEKIGLTKAADISDKDFVKYGTEAEKHLRALFALDFPQYNVFYEENNMWTNDKYPFAHYSADGWLEDENGRLGIWECKTTNILHSGQREKWDKKIPDNYYAQILWGLGVMEASFVCLKAQLKSIYNGEITLTTKHYFIERSDVEEDIAYIMEKGREFANLITTKTRPDLILPRI